MRCALIIQNLETEVLACSDPLIPLHVKGLHCNFVFFSFLQQNFLPNVDTQLMHPSLEITPSGHQMTCGRRKVGERVQSDRCPSRMSTL